MRALSKGIGSLLLLAIIGCAAGPTEQEILESLQATLRSVTGDWHAESFGANAIALDFRLQEDGNGNVSGAPFERCSTGNVAASSVLRARYVEPPQATIRYSDPSEAGCG